MGTSQPELSRGIACGAREERRQLSLCSGVSRNCRRQRGVFSATREGIIPGFKGARQGEKA